MHEIDGILIEFSIRHAITELLKSKDLYFTEEIFLFYLVIKS